MKPQLKERCRDGEEEADERDVGKFTWTGLQISGWGVEKRGIAVEGSGTFDCHSLREESGRKEIYEGK